MAKVVIIKCVGELFDFDFMVVVEVIIWVVNFCMVGVIWLVFIECGHNLGDFVVMFFGGGGVFYVGALIKDVGLKSVLVFCYFGVILVLGCIIVDMWYDFV